MAPSQLDTEMCLMWCGEVERTFVITRYFFPLAYVYLKRSAIHLEWVGPVLTQSRGNPVPSLGSHISQVQTRSVN